jgi:hypothetical protein
MLLVFKIWIKDKDKKPSNSEVTAIKQGAKERVLGDGPTTQDHALPHYETVQFNHCKLDPFHNQVIDSKEALERTNVYTHLDAQYTCI